MLIKQKTLHKIQGFLFEIDAISQKSNESYIFSPYGLFHGPQV